MKVTGHSLLGEICTKISYFILHTSHVLSMDSNFPPTSGCAPVAHDESGVGGFVVFQSRNISRIRMEPRIKRASYARDKQEQHARHYALGDANASVPSAFPSRTAPNVYSCNILINYTQG